MVVLCTTFFSLFNFKQNFLVGEKNLPGSGSRSGSGSGLRFLAGSGSGSGFNEYGSETLKNIKGKLYVLDPDLDWYLSIRIRIRLLYYESGYEPLVTTCVSQAESASTVGFNNNNLYLHSSLDLNAWLKAVKGSIAEPPVPYWIIKFSSLGKYQYNNFSLGHLHIFLYIFV